MEYMRKITELEEVIKIQTQSLLFWKPLGCKYKLELCKSKLELCKVSSKKRTITEKQRIEVFNRDKGICYCCGIKIPRSEKGERLPWCKYAYHCSHLKALDNGGLETLDNMVCACSKCNSACGTEDFRDFKLKYRNNILKISSTKRKRIYNLWELPQNKRQII